MTSLEFMRMIRLPVLAGNNYKSLCGLNTSFVCVAEALTLFWTWTGVRVGSTSNVLSVNSRLALLPAAALLNNHILVLFVNDVIAGVNIQYTDGA